MGVLPSKVVAEAPMFVKTAVNSQSLLPMPEHHDFDHAKTGPQIMCGIEMKHAPAEKVPIVDFKEINKAIHTWDTFQISPTGLGDYLNIAKGLVADKLPGSKH